MTPKFSTSRYNSLLRETFATAEKLSKLKGGEYAGDDDRLANFRRNGEAFGLPMETVWGVYAGKHWDAICQYIKDMQTGTQRARLEGLAGRADDLIVYLLLFKAMLLEHAEYKSLLTNLAFSASRGKEKDRLTGIDAALSDADATARRDVAGSLQSPAPPKMFGGEWNNRNEPI